MVRSPRKHLVEYGRSSHIQLLGGGEGPVFGHPTRERRSPFPACPSRRGVWRASGKDTAIHAVVKMHVGGSGSGKVNVHQDDMGGWVRVFADRTTNLPDDLPVFLSHALTDWFRQRPQLTMRCVV